MAVSELGFIVLKAISGFFWGFGSYLIVFKVLQLKGLIRYSLTFILIFSRRAYFLVCCSKIISIFLPFRFLTEGSFFAWKRKGIFQRFML